MSDNAAFNRALSDKPVRSLHTVSRFGRHAKLRCETWHNVALT